MVQHLGASVGLRLVAANVVPSGWACCGVVSARAQGLDGIEDDKGTEQSPIISSISTQASKSSGVIERPRSDHGVTRRMATYQMNQPKAQAASRAPQTWSSPQFQGPPTATDRAMAPANQKIMVKDSSASEARRWKMLVK